MTLPDIAAPHFYERFLHIIKNFIQVHLQNMRNRIALPATSALLRKGVYCM